MPISRVYTVIEQITETEREGVHAYKGFDQNLDPNRLNIIAIVKVEDSVEVWALDDLNNSLRSFVQYLSDRSDAELCNLIGVFRKGIR